MIEFAFHREESTSDLHLYATKFIQAYLLQTQKYLPKWCFLSIVIVIIAPSSLWRGWGRHTPHAWRGWSHSTWRRPTHRTSGSHTWRWGPHSWGWHWSTHTCKINDGDPCKELVSNPVAICVSYNAQNI